MPPKSPWKKGTQKTKKNESLLQPAAADQADGSAINCSEIQSDELESLSAIYMEDYQEVELKSAWNKTTDHAFNLKIKSSSDESTFIVLSVRLTATYPKTRPVLHISEGLQKLHVATQKRIQGILDRKPNALAGQAMIYDIAQDIEEALEDAVQSREQGVLPSLEDERMIQEATAQEQAEAAEAEEAKRAEAEQAEQDRIMDQMVSQQAERLNKRRSKGQRGSNPGAHHERIQDSNNVFFDQPISLDPRTDVEPFRLVSLFSLISSQGGNEIVAAQPRPDSDSGALNFMLAVRRMRLSVAQDAQSKSNLQALEQELVILRGLRNTNTVNVYAFKLERADSDAMAPSPVQSSPLALQDWDVTILTELANRGNLAEMLEDGQVVPVHKARQWSIDILEAIEFYHRQNIIHKRIHARNVLFFRSNEGVVTPKLADAAYEDRLLRIKARSDASEKPKRISAWPAPECRGSDPKISSRSDVWDYGVLLSQMLFGTLVTRRYSDPMAMLRALDVSEPLEDMFQKIFNKDAKIRPSAFELLTSEFFRTDMPVLSTEHSASGRSGRHSSSSGLIAARSPDHRRSRHSSSNASDAFSDSRYAKDFVELGRLGRGGFGEVVKARNKVDGGIYAIKKVKQISSAQLDRVLQEVIWLNRLNHPHVVRYYSAWTERDMPGREADLNDESVSSMRDSSTASASQDIDRPSIDFGMSSRGLDFVSSQGFNIEFAEDSDEAVESDDDRDTLSRVGTNGTASYGKPLSSFQSPLGSVLSESDAELSDASPRKRRPSHRRVLKSTLYIQMEYCERHTLRDLIHRGIYNKPDEGWHMFRQILEGLAYIHSNSVIHRDLKPDNVFIDNSGNPRIGDFGLATTSLYQTSDKSLAASITTNGGDMTRSIGTALYVAPEVKSGAGNYNEKVDMYSLGIIFFEMCYPLKTSMERHHVLTGIRQKEHSLPVEFQSPEKALQGSIILSLISHAPSERPTSFELLRSGKLPLQIEDETVRQTLQNLSDSASPFYLKTMTALFSRTPDQRIKELAWDKNSKLPDLSADDLRVRDIAKQTITSVFRRHGAEEAQRPLLFPRSEHYRQANNVVQLLDQTGNLLQLPWDNTLPHARQLARQAPPVERTFVFGNVFREQLGGQPLSIGEVDFDIVSKTPDDQELQEAEVIKVVDEIIDEVPALAASNMCIHINHSDLLDVILDFCHIDNSQRPDVKETLSKLHIHQYPWSKAKVELRSPPCSVHSTVLDDLVQFDMREAPEKVYSRLMSIMEGSPHANRIRRPIEHIKRVVDNLKLLGVHRRIYICPLSSINTRLFTGGILFSCVYDKKNRSVLAAGGRYDRLIEEHRPRGLTASDPRCAVGVSIGWNQLVSTIVRYRRHNTTSAYTKKHIEHDASDPIWDAKRCDVLLASSDPTVLRSTGIKILANLWSADISAELATDSRSIDDLLSRQRESSHSWIIIVKHDAISTLKVRNVLTDTETEIPTSNLVSHLRLEMRERDHAASNTTNRPWRHPALLRHSSHHNNGTSTGTGAADDEKRNIHVMFAAHRSKKTNKMSVVTSTRETWVSHLERARTAPLLAIETNDAVLESMRGVSLGDSDAWRRVVQSVSVNEREYMQDVYSWLLERRKAFRAAKEKGGVDGEGEGAAAVAAAGVVGVVNFRSGKVVYCDLGT